MKELKQILNEHFILYPKMEIADFVKLVYQNEFGCEHLLRNRLECREWLENELKFKDLNYELDLYENIGSGLVRLNIGSAIKNNISLDQMVEAIIQTLKNHQGNILSFKKKLKVLKAFLLQHHFNKNDIDKYLLELEHKGYYLLPHSLIYRKEYNPHYRVVLKNQIKK